MSGLMLYTKPNCPQCTQTKKKLEQKGVEYTTVDITLDNIAAEKVLSLGYKQVPVVINGAEHWSGFRPDLLNKL